MTAPKKPSKDMKKLPYRRKQVQAMRKLLRNYEDRLNCKRPINAGLDNCPLCTLKTHKRVIGFSKTIKYYRQMTLDDNCENCVWMVATGKRCFINISDIGDVRAYAYGGVQYTRKILEIRVRQLKEWIERWGDGHATGNN